MEYLKKSTECDDLIQAVHSTALGPGMKTLHAPVFSAKTYERPLPKDRKVHGGEYDINRSALGQRLLTDLKVIRENLK